MDFKYRQALAKIRIRAHNLKIETGRYIGIERKDRICSHCKVIEEEWHFLDHCVKFHNERSTFLQSIYSTNPSWIQLFPSDFFLQQEAQTHLGKYVFQCFAKYN